MKLSFSVSDMMAIVTPDDPSLVTVTGKLGTECDGVPLSLGRLTVTGKMGEGDAPPETFDGLRKEQWRQ